MHPSPLPSLTLCALLSPVAWAQCQAVGHDEPVRIETVAFNDRLITSGKNGGYRAHPEGIVLFAQGNRLTLTPAFAGFSTDLYWRIWADLDRNGEFDDTEIVFNGRSAGPIRAQFDLSAKPASAGATLRIGVRVGDYPRACGSVDGDIEDIAVAFSGDPAPRPDRTAALTSATDPVRHP